jgi:hypothetical protein
MRESDLVDPILEDVEQADLARPFEPRALEPKRPVVLLCVHEQGQ